MKWDTSRKVSSGYYNRHPPPLTPDTLQIEMKAGNLIDLSAKPAPSFPVSTVYLKRSNGCLF